MGVPFLNLVISKQMKNKSRNSYFGKDSYGIALVMQKKNVSLIMKKMHISILIHHHADFKLECTYLNSR